MRLRTALSFLPALALCGLSLAQDPSLPGPHGAGKRSVTVTRPGGTTFTALLYYPATATGSGAAFDPSGAPYPGVSFGHGFFQAADAYESTLQHLATWGYFVIATTTQGGLSPSHQAMADDMRHCLTWLEQQDADTASPYFHAVDTAAFALTGHSMGGGASILAAAADPRVRALAPLAPAETSPSAITAMGGVLVPTRLICGTQDTIVPTASNGQPMYDAAPGPRQLLSIVGGWHCGFVDTPALGGFGCDSGTLTRAAQLAIVRRHLTTFLELHLRGDASRWNSVWGPQALLDGSTQVLRDARCRFSPSAARQAGAAGQVLDFALAVTNQGAQAASYSLFVENNQWPTALSSAQTAVLLPGQSETVHVQVTIPAASAFATDRCLVSARSDVDGQTRCYARLGSRRL
jgi:dienelactone hydrolase